jgi:hypothetical protein
VTFRRGRVGRRSAFSSSGHRQRLASEHCRHCRIQSASWTIFAAWPGLHITAGALKGCCTRPPRAATPISWPSNSPPESTANSAFSKGRTPLIANVRGSCPSAATVRALLEGGADPSSTDEFGLTALDYAGRKLTRLDAPPARDRRKSPSLDETDQIRLDAAEQDELGRIRGELPGADRDYLGIW